MGGRSPGSERAPRRLTRSAKGENGAAFLPDGSLLFVSERPDPDVSDDEPVSALWRLPAGGGEAGVLATRPGGVGGVVVARDSGTIVVSSDTLPGSLTAEDDQKRRTARKDTKVSAILHETYPIRFWDHDLGPDTPRLMVGDAPGEARRDDRSARPDGHVGTALSTDEASWSITPGWGNRRTSAASIVERGGSDRLGITAIDTASGRRVELLSTPTRIPRQRFRSTGRASRSSWRRGRRRTEPPDVHLGMVELSETACPRPVADVAADWDRWPGQPVWLPDGSALIVGADSDGGAPLFRIDLDGTVTRLTADRGTYSGVCVDPDGRWVYAMRTAIDAAPARCASRRLAQTSSRQCCAARLPRRPCQVR